MGIKTNCLQCRKEIEVFSYLYKTMEKHFCSSTCYGLWQRGKKLSPERIRLLIGSHRLAALNVSCEVCGKEFHKHPSAISKHNFCSRKHRYSFMGWPKKGYSVNFKCQFCGKLFYRYAVKIPAKYCSQNCYFQAIKKPFIIKEGYKKILNPSHPRADMKGYVFEHILILEEKLGRPFRKNEVSHHFDGNGLNNSPDNLVAYPNHSIHMKRSHSHLHRHNSK